MRINKIYCLDTDTAITEKQRLLLRNRVLRRAVSVVFILAVVVWFAGSHGSCSCRRRLSFRADGALSFLAPMILRGGSVPFYRNNLDDLANPTRLGVFTRG